MSRNPVKKTFLCLLFLGICLPVFAQNYTAVNYQRSTGFPGNKVYSLYQDSYNYIWAGTENGLVSFNGYEFKAYTTKDGLPNSEVLGMKEDRWGRLWILTFSNELCYLWRGRIYHAGNDTLLHKLRLSSLPRDMGFDRDGNMWIRELSGYLTCVNSRNEISRTNKINGDLIQPDAGLILKDTGNLIFYNGTKTYQYNKGRFELLELPGAAGHIAYHDGLSKFNPALFRGAPLEKVAQLQVSLRNNNYFPHDWPSNLTFFEIISQDILATVIHDEAFLIDLNTGKKINRFLKGYKVSFCLMARDSSLWFGTMGNGLFHYVPSFISSVSVLGNSAPVLFIKAKADDLYFIEALATTVHMRKNHQEKYDLVRVVDASKELVEHYPCYIGQDKQYNWIRCGNGVSKSKVLGSEAVYRQLDGYFTKAVWEESERHLLIGTVNGIFRIDKDRFTVTDSLYDRRVTSLVKVNNTIYAGTLTGLLAIDSDKKKGIFPFKHPALCYGITAVAVAKDSLVWAANSKAVLIGIDKEQIIARIGDKDGLACNSIVTMKVSDSFLWVGTDNGLYAFGNKAPYSMVRHLSSADGLNSNQITYLEINEGRVWVGTDKGLNYFDEKEIKSLNTVPRFIITSIRNDDNILSGIGNIMELQKSTLSIDYDVIDHSGITKPRFTYRLNNNRWTDLATNNLYFPTLPYGHFSIQIRAESPHWKVPRVIALSFYRAYPYYLQGWFIVIIVLVLLLIVGAAGSLVIKQLRKNDQKKLIMQLNLLELEQMALQGQMNPHFIFNSIASIKEYYNSGDIIKANRLLDTFTSLIRTTFEISAQTFTTLGDELKYLNQYLQIEQERFNNSFSFSIDTQIQVPESQVPVPTMLLQPLVENAVRHGMRHLPDGKGKIAITIVQQQEIIAIAIADNGLGRRATLEMKKRQYFHNSVTSTTVNEKRIDILNKILDQKINIHIEDIKEEEHHTSGTIVTISYPLNIQIIGK